jgi:hypothetical protein
MLNLNFGRSAVSVGLVCFDSSSKTITNILSIILSAADLFDKIKSNLSL